MRTKKLGPIVLTNPPPTVEQMAKTLGASKKEVKDARRLVAKLVRQKNAHSFDASLPDARTDQDKTRDFQKESQRVNQDGGRIHLS